jgi:type I restriction-modification system DNA methylase subunit
MPPKTKTLHKCETCKTVFNKKTELTKHLKLHKNNSCGSTIEMQQNEEQDIKQTFKRVFSGCLDIMRDEGITGEKSLDNIVSLITLKFLEPLFREDNKFNINDYNEIIENELGEENLEHNKIILSKMLYFSNLMNEKEFGDDTKTITENELPNRMKHFWDIILSRYYLTNKIYLKNKGFDIKNKSTYSKIIEKLNLIKYQNGFDLLGQAYEDVIKDIATKGKTLGQFFTQPVVKNICIELVKPKILPDGTIETICDPTMGTGGFIITSLKYILKQAEENGITPDWNFIKKNGFYGKEINYETYKLAFSNMLISSGKLFENLEHGDSIREPITKKFDIVLANPPYGIKGLDYDSFVIESTLKNKYIPIKSKNAVSLFIQAIICMLNINGRCAVVLPDGQDMFSKSDKTLVSIREYLMKTCDLKEIIYLPPGSFENTSIKTCIFYFEKRVEGIDVMGSKIIYTKTNKEKGREYIFKPKLQTTSIKFYNHTEEGKQLLIEVPIDKIVENSYSLNYAEYLEKKEETVSDGIVMKTLGELFYITKGSLQSSKNVEGDYTFITASDTNKTHNIFTHDCECVMLVGGAEGSLAKAQYFNGKFIASDLLYLLISKNENEINYKYIWYYLNSNREKHLLDDSICCGTPKKMISKERCSNIKIPIPSLARQKEIVEYCEYNDTLISQLEKEIENNKKQTQKCLNMIVK